MPAFIALESSVIESGDIVPTPIYADVDGVIVRIVDAGQAVEQSHLNTVHAQDNPMLIPARMSSAFADYAAGRFDGGDERYFIALLVARLSHLAFGPICAESLGALNRVAQQLVHMPRADLCQMFESHTLKNTGTWVKTHAVCALLMALVVKDESISSDLMQGLVFASLIHDLDGLIRGSTDLKTSTSEQAITLSVLAHHYPVAACVHETLLHFRERTDGSGSPFGYTAGHIPRFAQYLGLLSTLSQTSERTPMHPLELFNTVRPKLTQLFAVDVVETVGTSFARCRMPSGHQ